MASITPQPSPYLSLCDERTVYWFSERKREWFLLLLILCWLAGGWILVVCVTAGVLVHQWRAFHEAIEMHRKRGPTLVLHSGSEWARERASKVAKDETRPAEVRAISEFDPWLLLRGSNEVLFFAFFCVFQRVELFQVVFVVGSDEIDRVGCQRLLFWLENETQTRKLQGRLYGWNTNIVYTGGCCGGRFLFSN